VNTSKKKQIFVSLLPIHFLVLSFSVFSLASNTSAQSTTTFRGHTLGENWQTFVRTERGLCRLDETNAEECKRAAAGKKAFLQQGSKENHASATFFFEAGHFVRASTVMTGPKFAGLTFLENAYGPPSSKSTDPEKGEAFATWDFPDGGTVGATETTDASGRATITIIISAKDMLKKPQAKNTAEDVCSFIVGRIRQAVPDAPTMCHAAETSSISHYEVTVFSTVDVLQGKLRRAWSTALFDAAQDLFYGKSLGGICNKSSEGVLCQVFFADSEMVRSTARYKLFSVPKEDLKQTGLYGDPSSDEWYRAWWLLGFATETFSNPGSQSHAKWAAQKACELYKEALQDDSQSFGLKSREASMVTCSAIVATDATVYIQIDFPDGIPGILANFAFPLPETFGKLFSGLPYDGAVVMRVPWRNSEGLTRDVESFGLSYLKFLYDEVHSGSRSATEASWLVLEHMHPGQRDKDVPTDRAILGGVVDVTPMSDGRLLVKGAGGSLWSVAKSCQFKVGDSLALAYDPAGKLELANMTQVTFCAGPDFVGAW
jgi:hypothetical protein